jgi:hypothetical protein
VDPGLNLILLPDGDLENHVDQLQLLINLKRLGCGTRNAISLRNISDAQADKFYQSFKISKKISLSSCVTEMIRLLQKSLFLLGCLPLNSILDGLLCDITMAGIKLYRETLPSANSAIENEGVCEMSIIISSIVRIIVFRTKLSMLVKDVCGIFSVICVYIIVLI